MSDARPFTNVIGFDDAPFAREHRGDVAVIGTVYASERLDGVLRGKVRRDGQNSTKQLTDLVRGQKFREHVRCVLLQGIALAGFNVVDLPGLHEALAIPVLVVSRKKPRMGAVRRALLERVPGGARKWALIEAAGPMEPCAGVWVQRAGLSPAEAEATLREHARYGSLPEPLRVAHLLAGAYAEGVSRGRA